MLDRVSLLVHEGRKGLPGREAEAWPSGDSLSSKIQTFGSEADQEQGPSLFLRLCVPCQGRCGYVCMVQHR